MYHAASIESRRADCARLLAAHPGAVPVMAQAAKSAASAKPVLVALPRSATVADLAQQLQCRKATTLLVSDCAPATNTTLGDLHDCCSADDGFLHVTMLSEAPMGDTTAIGCCQARIGSDDDEDDCGRKKPRVVRSMCCNVAVVE